MKKSQMNTFEIEMIKGLLPKEEPVVKAANKLSMLMVDPFGPPVDEKGNPLPETSPPTLAKSILNVLNGQKGSIERLAFESDPSYSSSIAGLYKQKTRLIPDAVLKRIMIQDDLVASIINARANHISSFGRPRPDRHAKGFIIEPRPGVLDKMKQDQKDELQTRIDQVEKKLVTCGSEVGVAEEDRLTFAQYLFMSTKNAVGLGRSATEVVWAIDPSSGQRVFHSFRPIDAGTIYRAVPYQNTVGAVREQAKALLEQVKNKKFEKEFKDQKKELTWIQAVDGKAIQAFSSDECLVHNFYPTNDIEMDGYPVTPLDTVISAVTMHINITSHNKLYFQSGRAARGMLVIKSDDVDDQVIGKIRQQFNATINGTQNSWRMPVFGVGGEDDISWQPIDNSSRDMEFQYLADSNARTILSAFQMSPEELPGYTHLSKGTASQALAETNSEYILTAARDVGLRPLLDNWSDFINQRLFPLIDASLSKLCTIKLVGLDAETAEKESIRLAQDLPLHMTIDEMLEKVEKDPIGKEMGGEFLLNPQWQQLVAPYLTVGEILEKFFGRAEASKAPELNYRRDAFWFQQQQMMQQQQQMAMQQQQMAQQQQQGGPPPQGGGRGSGGGGGPPPQGAPEQDQGAVSESAQQDDQQSAQIAHDELSQGVDGAQQALGKSEDTRPLSAEHDKVLSKFHEMWKKESVKAIKEIVGSILDEE